MAGDGCGGRQVTQRIDIAVQVILDGVPKSAEVFTAVPRTPEEAGEQVAVVCRFLSDLIVVPLLKALS